MTSRWSMLIFFVDFLVVVAGVASATDTVWENICHKVAAAPPDNRTAHGFAVGYDFCVKTLKSANSTNGGLSPLTPRHLASVAARLAAASGAATLSKIYGELMNCTEAMNGCSEPYTRLVGLMKDATFAVFDKSVADRGLDAVKLFQEALDIVEDCEIEFDYLGSSKAPLTADYEKNKKLINLAAAIFSLKDAVKLEA